MSVIMGCLLLVLDELSSLLSLLFSLFMNFDMIADLFGNWVKGR